MWPKQQINLLDLHRNAKASNSTDGLADLQAAESLLRGMINSDGIVLFGTDGTVLAYHVFVKPKDDEAMKLPDIGGGRRRTFELMKLRLPSIFKAVFFRSQDGATGCERA